MSKTTPSVRTIIQRVGAKKLHLKSKALVEEGLLEKEIAEKTIYSWFENGIPEWRWGFVMQECDVTESDLHQANESLRKTQESASRRPGSSKQAAA